MSKPLFKVTGDQKIIKAFKTLGDKVSKGVVMPAAKRAAATFQMAIRAGAPELTGALRKSAKVKTAKGPRVFSGRKVVAFAAIIGQARPTKSQQRKGTRIPFYAFMQEKGYHTGARVRKGKQVVGYTPLKGHKEVKYHPGKHFAKKAMQANEANVMNAMLYQIYQGIERVASTS